MSKIVRVQGGDYKVIVGSLNGPGTITLDTNRIGEIGDEGYAQGKVVITGDLEVQGNTTIVQSETLTIKDNIIYLNVGETNAGVATLGTSSGIQIDRGTLPDVSMLWDETVEQIVFKDANDTLQGIATISINTRGENLSLISEGNGVITVAGTTDYEWNVLNQDKVGIVLEINSVRRTDNVSIVETTDLHNLVLGDRVNITCTTDGDFTAYLALVAEIVSDTEFSYENIGDDLPLTSAEGVVRPDIVRDDDYVPNMRAVMEYSQDALLSFTTNKISEGGTKVQTYSVDVSGVNQISFDVQNPTAPTDTTRVKINNDFHLLVDDKIYIRNNSIGNQANDNIYFENVLSIPNRVAVPPVPIGYVKLYSKTTPGTGGTGLYFVTSAQPGLPAGINDELISKTKAFLYSLIL